LGRTSDLPMSRWPAQGSSPVAKTTLLDVDTRCRRPALVPCDYGPAPRVVAATRLSIGPYVRPDGCYGWSRPGLCSLGHSGCGGRMPCHDVDVSRNGLSQLSSGTPHSGCRVRSHRELPGLVLSLSSSVRAGHVTSSAPKAALLEVVPEQIVSRPLTW
jgi:hypothetical protein